MSSLQYDRIDPSDVQALRDEIEDLQIDIKRYEEAQETRAKEAEVQAKLVRYRCKTRFQTSQTDLPVCAVGGYIVDPG